MAFKLKKFMKALAHSGSYRFAMDFAGAGAGGRPLDCIRWKGMPFNFIATRD